MDQRGGPAGREAEFPLLRFLEEWMEKLKGEQKERHLHKEAADNREGEGLEK